MISVKRILALLLCLALAIGMLASCDIINGTNKPDGGVGDNNQGGNTDGDNQGGNTDDDNQGGNTDDENQGGNTDDENQGGNTDDDNQGDNKEDNNDDNGNTGSDTISADKYQASVRVVFASNDDKMKDALDSVSSSSVVCRDGKLVSVSTETATDNLLIKNNYTLCDGMLYHSLSAESADYSVTQLRRARFSATDIYVFNMNAGLGASITEDDFNTVDHNGANIICQNIKEEVAIDLASDITAKLSYLNATVNIKSASLNIVTKDELKVSAILSCSLEIVVGEQAYEVTMRTYTNYDYEAEISITAPANADEYALVLYQEIIK